MKRGDPLPASSELSRLGGYAQVLNGSMRQLCLLFIRQVSICSRFELFGKVVHACKRIHYLSRFPTVLVEHAQICLFPFEPNCAYRFTFVVIKNYFAIILISASRNARTINEGMEYIFDSLENVTGN